MAYLRLIDEICEDVLNEDWSFGGATGCRKDLKQSTSELPPGSVRGTPERHGASELVKCVFVTRCIVIALLYPCKTVLLSRSTLYVKNVIRERNEGVCAQHLRPSLPRRHRDFP
jgi:hypothetical protein